MSVDPALPRKILVVHGVQTGSDENLDQDRLVHELVSARLGGIPVRFETGLYRYENVNDRAVAKLRKLLVGLARTPLNAVAANTVLELAGDVVISLADGSTAAEIRRGLRRRIEEIFHDGNPCYLVAHSLGSIYALDVLKQLMKERDLFNRASRRSWPVQGLITLGSPIGLGMFRKGARRTVASLGPGTKMFRWVNYWDRMDPVVSGDIFGTALRGFAIAERFLTDSERQGWAIHDMPVDTGKAWLLAHTAYWGNPMVGDGLVNMITN